MNDITYDLEYWKTIANHMAKNHPDQQFKIVKGIHGEYMACSLGTKTGCETVYVTES